MNTKVYLGIALRIIAVFIGPMFVSYYITPQLTHFFNDTHFTDGSMSPGWRHVLFWIMGACLWILSVTNLWMSAEKLWKKYQN